MAGRKVMILVGTAAFVAGSVLGLVVAGYAGSLSLQRLMDVQVRVNLQATAQRAQTELHQLELLRSGEVGEVVDQLERFVDSRAIALGVYEDFLADSAENSYARRVMVEIDAHRAQFPPTVHHPALLARLAEALAKAKKGDGIQER